jgi:hypothetical protein
MTSGMSSRTRKQRKHMTFDILEWIGYLASSIVLISLLMRSVKKLRWVNLAGSLLFSFYGFMIGAIPVGVMNAGIVVINVVYLWKMIAQKDYFKLLEASMDTDYLSYFLDFYKDDMNRFMTVPQITDDPMQKRYYVLRNSAIAGLIVLKQESEGTMRILVDYAIPAYRDFKIGRFVFVGQKSVFTDQGITRLVSASVTKEHTKYLLKMGFKEATHGDYVLSLS